jgi:hypothetical protein
MKPRHAAPSKSTRTCRSTDRTRASVAVTDADTDAVMVLVYAIACLTSY